MDNLLKDLIATGLSEWDIVHLLEDDGIKTAQSTISRLKNGIYKSTSYTLGAGIVALHARICAKKGRKKKA